MAQEHVPVLIVGAGGAGLSLSLLLQQQGIPSLLIERRSDVAWYPRARNLNFRTLEIFRGLGLEAEVIAAGTHVSRMFRKETLASPERQEFPSVEQALYIADHPETLTPEPTFWYCPQSRLEPLLLAAARQRGGDVRYNTELVSFTQGSKGVSATILDRATGTSSVIQADYLAACDGAHSHVRSALGVKAEGLGALDDYFIFVYFRADWSELIRGYEADAILIDRPDVHGIFLITDVDRGMFTINYIPSQGESAQNYPAERCRDLIEKGMGKPDLAVEVVDIVPWQPYQLVAEHFQQGRVFLVGDAAHAMPPQGNGVNAAIQGAQNLAWKLAAVLKGHASQGLLATYQAERRPVGWFDSEQGLIGATLKLALKGAEDARTPPVKEASMFYQIVGYRYRSQAIVSEDTAPPEQGKIELLERPEFTGEPGTRVPHLWLERGGQRISTLDLLDGRFVLLTGAGGTAWSQAAAAVAQKVGIALSTYRIGADADLIDLENGWQTKMGVSSEGAILVRPDGFVAWRTDTLPTSPEASLEQVLISILCRSTPATNL